jgi:hypothetical protein
MKDKLIDLYVNKELKLKEVGIVIGCSDATVLRYMREYGIPTRPRSTQKYPQLNLRQLKEWYVDYGWSAIKIAEAVGCSDAAVLKALKKFGIYVRSHKEAAENKEPMTLEHKARVIQNIRKLHKIQVGEGHPKWKNARWHDSDGYALVRHNKKTVKEHRWIMGQRLGRELMPYEEVNHINGIRDDNRPENLEVIYSEHKHKDWLRRNAQTTSKNNSPQTEKSLLP